MADDSGEGEPAKWTRRQTRDVIAIVLLAAGGVGLAATAFTWDDRAGWAAVCVLVVMVGVIAGVE